MRKGTIAVLAALLALAILPLHAGDPVTIADITGDGAKHQLAASGTARWIQFVALAANSGVARIGDTNVTTSRGAAIAAGGGFMMPPLPSGYPMEMAEVSYDLSKIYYVIPAGDKLTVLIWR